MSLVVSLGLVIEGVENLASIGFARLLGIRRGFIAHLCKGSAL